MPLMQLTLETLQELDNGRASKAFMHELKRAASDCMDRPGDKNAREVSLVLKLTPVSSEDGQCDTVHGEFQVKSKVPTRKTKTYSFDVRKGGHLSYSVDSPDNVDQRTLLS